MRRGTNPNDVFKSESFRRDPKDSVAILAQIANLVVGFAKRPVDMFAHEWQKDMHEALSSAKFQCRQLPFLRLLARDAWLRLWEMQVGGPRVLSEHGGQGNVKVVSPTDECARCVAKATRPRTHWFALEYDVDEGQDPNTHEGETAGRAAAGGAAAAAALQLAGEEPEENEAEDEAVDEWDEEEIIAALLEEIGANLENKEVPFDPDVGDAPPHDEPGVERRPLPQPDVVEADGGALVLAQPISDVDPALTAALRRGRWGVFVVTPKKTGWQARCVFHRL